MLSVIIPSCNRTDLIKKCIESLHFSKQSLSFELYEVIVTDDSEDTASKDFIQNNFNWVKWVEGPKKGPAANRNNGARYAKGEWLVFIDDDCLPDKNLLNEYFNGIKKNPACLAFEGAIHPDNSELLKNDMAECPVNMDGGLFWSANICVQKELFENIGGFNEQFLIAAQEDQEIYHRLLQHTQILFCKKCIVIHPVRYRKLKEKIKRIPIEIRNWILFARLKRSWSGVFFDGAISQIKACIRTLREYRFKMLIYHFLSLVYLFPILVLFAFQNARKQKFNWVSSSDKNNSLVLQDLNKKMINFYSDIASRNSYQQMVDNQDNDLNDPGIVTVSFINFLKKISPQKILEVGCGRGRIYQFIKKDLNNIEYTGIEVSENIIEKNRAQYPQSNWLVSDAYKINFADGTFDVCFSFYVLEHLVFPESALNEMMRVVKENGYLILIFPDFAISGRFGSQSIGLGNEATAFSKLKKGKIIDAFISLYDSRIRLPKALKDASKNHGNFPVNINPKCLAVPNIKMSPDIDAVYISSKKEIEYWASKQGFSTFYPAGTKHYFSEHSFLSIKRL